MAYTEVTNIILDLCAEANALLSEIETQNTALKENSQKTDEIIKTVHESVNDWGRRCIATLSDNGLRIETEGFQNYRGTALFFPKYDEKLGNYRNYLLDRKDFLIQAAKDLENRKKEIELVPLKIDDIDSFSQVRSVDFSEVKDFSKSAFLEDDVEETFLDALGEPYKELDSGAETRDLFTDKLVVKGQRLNTAIMFKGRGVSTALTLDKCGAKGSQLLKLAKNNAAECFILEHVNKIEPEVKEL